MELGKRGWLKEVLTHAVSTHARDETSSAAKKTGKAAIKASGTMTVTEDQRRGMIALSAYLRAERRGFSPEGQAEDWLAAEAEVDALLNSGHTAPQ